MADVDFAGESFRTADRIGVMPLMRFAKVAQAGVDANEMAGLAAMYDLLEQCIDPADWLRFQAHADKVRADGDELMAVVKAVIEALSDRPTSRPSDSSDGPSTTSTSSLADSSSQVIVDFERKGRPQLAAQVLLAQQARASRASA